MTEEEFKHLNSALTLPLSAGNSPFSPSEEELRLSPEDWAWLFLRLDENYRKDFKQQANRERRAVPAPLFTNPSDAAAVIADQDGSCGAQFGLGAWLDPEIKFLPKLSLYGSWFFPLASIEHIGPHPPEEARRRKIFSIRGYPHLPTSLVEETPFGYQIDAKHMHDLGLQASLRREPDLLIKIKIDCGIPPSGQLAAAINLIDTNRRFLRKIGGKFQRKEYISNLHSQIPLTAKQEDPPTFGENQEAESGNVRWVEINALGPLIQQKERLLKTLENEYRSIATGARFHNNWPKKLESKLPTAEDGDTRWNGIRYLKALLAIAELRQKFRSEHIEEYLIARKVGTFFEAHESYRTNLRTWWQKFHENIENKYFEDATMFIQSGYKWLIHSQKPENNASPPKRAKKSIPPRRKPDFKRGKTSFFPD